MRSEIRNQGGLYFVDSNFEGYFKYHLKAAEKAISQISDDDPKINQFDGFIKNHRKLLA